MKKRINSLILGTTIILFSFSFSGCSLLPKEEKIVAPALAEPPKIQYNTVEVKKGNVSKTLYGEGVFVSSNLHDIFFTHKGGYISKVYVTGAEVVKKGQILAEIDTEEIQREISQQQLKVRLAEIDLEQAKEAKADKYQIEKAEIMLKMEKSQLENLNSSINNSKLYADISGKVVYCAQPKIGQYVNAYETLFSIASEDQLQVEYSGDKIEEFKVGMKVILKTKDKTSNGEVTYNSISSAKPSSKERPFIRIKVLDNFNGSKPGDGVGVFLELSKKENVIVIDKTLVHKYEERPYVVILDNNARVEKFVEVGVESQDQIEIVSGLKEGDKIIK